jgi:chromosome segregation ATPase
MTQSNDLSQRVDRTEGQIVDLQMTANLILQAIDKNSTDIAALLEVSRRNSELGRLNSEEISALREGTVALQLSQLRTEAALQVFQQHTDAAIERHDAAIERHDATIERLDATIEQLRASNERTEQLLEYVIRRDRGQLE